VQAGDTFLLADKRLDDHVLSDPERGAERVLLVSLTTTAPHKERACVVQAGEHSWVRHETCVAYNHAKLVTLKQLHDWKDAGHLRTQDPLTPALLERIRRGAADSVDLPLELAVLLSDQGLLDL
jgi:hypothetical protein